MSLICLGISDGPGPQICQSSQNALNEIILKGLKTNMRYKNITESHDDHINNYRSDGFDKANRYNASHFRIAWILDSVTKNSTVLEVGCNGGTIAARLVGLKNCYVKGIDIVQDLVDKACKRGVFAEQGTAEDLSRYADNSFDFVICAEVLEHLFDPLPAMKEAFRVLKPGGKYIVTVPHPNGLMASSDKLGDYHQANFGVEELDTIFHSVFERNKVHYSEIPYIPEYCQANNIDPKMPQWIGLIAEK